MTEPIEHNIRRFIVDNFLFGQGGDKLKAADSFIDKGIIDSTGMMELVVFLEQTYGIKVEDHELIPQNLDSLERVTKFVEKKRAG